MVGKEVENVVERKEIKLRVMPQHSIQSVSAGAADNSFGNRTTLLGIGPDRPVQLVGLQPDPLPVWFKSKTF